MTERGSGRLWAPWRMEYIRRAEAEARRVAPGRATSGARGTSRSRGAASAVREAEGECLFCLLRHARDDRRDLVLLRRPNAYLMLNRFPYNPAHLMIAVSRHVASFGELLPDEWRDLADLTGLAERALAAEYRPHGINVGANLGRVAGAGFPGHLHLHLVPRWNGDTNFMPTIADTKVLPESLSRTWSRLHRALGVLARPAKTAGEEERDVAAGPKIVSRVASTLLAVAVVALVGSALYARFGSRFVPRTHGSEARVIRVQVLNGSGEGGVGLKVATFLREGGFQVVEVKNADRPDYFASMVVARRADTGPARAVARYLGGPPVIRQTWTSDLADVTVVLGSDRSRLHLDS